MRREIRFAAGQVRAGSLWRLGLWSLPEVLPTALSGIVVARAVDDGFLAGDPVRGLVWLAGLLLVSAVGALGTRMVFGHLGDVTEPFRDELVRGVVGGALGNAVAGRGDDGALARLTRQVEIVRDTFGGLLVAIRGFVVTAVAVVVGSLSVSPVIAVLIVPPFLLGLLAFAGMLGLAAGRHRVAVLADEQLAAVTSSVLAGARDVTATGTEEHAAALVAAPIAAQANAERRLAGVAALRTLCFAIGGWAPLLVLLFAGRWLVDGGLTAGALMGGLTYVLFGLQPALQNLVGGVGGSGLRFVVTLGRLLDAAEPPPSGRPGERARSSPVANPSPGSGAGRREIELRGVTFAYGPRAEPVLRDLDLTVPAGDHLAVVGPSGIGKSTLVSLVCGLVEPDAGTVTVGGIPATRLPPADRVLIPQEAYVFTATVRRNLTYLHDASPDELDAAVDAVGARPLLDRLGGYDADLAPAGLSAGERQLVALVRAYLAPAPIVVLDEATCHLDPAAERVAEEAFADRGRTLVVIAHRISSALRAGRVLVLDGAGAAHGDHAALTENSALYRELVGHWRPADVPAHAGG
ncbi:antibiotic ABC transporter ATP-binding protein [Actinophytocola xinjiangensis]|uniref:Antibiotic ABC transporter ATP-binding protein n=1 Tax=Actinophytocola xinjiangensis TaxID=485602 RepID=A0A7Z0WTF6_9PSEU|nr:ABC transporter ATP-binding protein [Actinophytocola xinjiangensis]OLF12919.1 antibiotic ABC transporter ATP-binding protein [Actinophytocola xinjiangensis]